MQIAKYDLWLLYPVLNNTASQPPLRARHLNLPTSWLVSALGLPSRPAWWSRKKGHAKAMSIVPSVTRQLEDSFLTYRWNQHFLWLTALGEMHIHCKYFFLNSLRVFPCGGNTLWDISPKGRAFKPSTKSLCTDWRWGARRRGPFGKWDPWHFNFVQSKFHNTSLHNILYSNLAKIRFQEAIKNIKLAFTLNQKVH